VATFPNRSPVSTGLLNWNISNKEAKSEAYTQLIVGPDVVEEDADALETVAAEAAEVQVGEEEEITPTSLTA
jgi:hypothetical protein